MDIRITKKRRSLFLIAGGALLFLHSFSSCYYDNKQQLFGLSPCDTSAVSFSADINPILITNCFLCHSAANADLNGAGYVLEGYDNVLGVVSAGDPANSLLYGTVSWLPGFNQMPQTGSQLSPCDIGLIRNWILQGAQNN